MSSPNPPARQWKLQFETFFDNSHKKLFEGGNFRWIFSQTLFDQILDPFLFHYTALLSHSNHLDQLLYC